MLLTPHFDMTIDLSAVATTVLAGLVLLVLQRLAATRELLSKQIEQVREQMATQNGRIGKLETINVEREKMMLEHVERVRGDIAKAEGKFDASHQHFDHEIRTMRDRLHEQPQQAHQEFLKVHVKIARIEQRLSIREES